MLECCEILSISLYFMIFTILFSFVDSREILIDQPGYYDYSFKYESATINISLNQLHAYIFSSSPLKQTDLDGHLYDNEQYLAFKGKSANVVIDDYQKIEVIIYILDNLNCMNHPFVIRGFPEVYGSLNFSENSYACGFSPIFQSEIKWNHISDSISGPNAKTIKIYKPNKNDELIHFKDFNNKGIYVTGSYYTMYPIDTQNIIHVKRRANYLEYFFGQGEDCGPPILVCDSEKCEKFTNILDCQEKSFIPIVIYASIFLIGVLIIFLIVFCVLKKVGKRNNRDMMLKTTQTHLLSENIKHQNYIG